MVAAVATGPPLLFLSKGSTLAIGFFNAATDAAAGGGPSVDCVEGADDGWLLPRCRLGMKLGAKGDGVGRAGPAAASATAGAGGVAIG